MRHIQQPSILELPSRQHEMPGRPTQAAKYTRVKAQARRWCPRKQSYQLHNLQANPPSQHMQRRPIQKYHQATTSMTGTKCPAHHDGADQHIPYLNLNIVIHSAPFIPILFFCSYHIPQFIDKFKYILFLYVTIRFIISCYSPKQNLYAAIYLVDFCPI